MGGKGTVIPLAKDLCSEEGNKSAVEETIKKFGSE